MAPRPKLGFFGVVSGISQLIGLGQSLASMLPRSTPEYEEPPLENTHPMEGMASAGELEQYRYREKFFYHGRTHSDHKQDFEIGIGDDRHIFLVAGNASGKGRSILVQNALRWRDGFVGIDPKRELASIITLRRGQKHQPISTFADGTGTRRKAVDAFCHVAHDENGDYADNAFVHDVHPNDRIL